MKKILVIGGAYQGKTKWVEKTFPQYQNISIETLLEESKLGKITNNIWVNKFHLGMKQWLVEKREYKKILQLIKKNPSWLIVSDEIGNGIVPMNEADRKWREETGRILCDLAKEADEVYRIYSGIAIKIKGSEV